jgi:hypothetical protein
VGTEGGLGRRSITVSGKEKERGGARGGLELRCTEKDPKRVRNCCGGLQKWESLRGFGCHGLGSPARFR